MQNTLDCYAAWLIVKRVVAGAGAFSQYARYGQTVGVGDDALIGQVFTNQREFPFTIITAQGYTGVHFGVGVL